MIGEALKVQVQENTKASRVLTQMIDHNFLVLTECKHDIWVEAALGHNLTVYRGMFRVSCSYQDQQHRQKELQIIHRRTAMNLVVQDLQASDFKTRYTIDHSGTLYCYRSITL